MSDQSAPSNLGTLAPAGYYLGLRIGFHFAIEEVNSLPSAWTERYVRERYFMSDPVNKWVHSKSGCCRWSALGVSDPRGVLSEAREYGLRFGAVVSIFDEDGERTHSFGSFARTDREFTDAEISRLEVELRRRHDDLEPPGDLTAGEIQALALVRDGLRLKQVAFELGVTERAIKQRLRNARNKLGAVTVAQAISVATGFGLI